MTVGKEIEALREQLETEKAAHLATAKELVQLKNEKAASAAKAAEPTTFADKRAADAAYRKLKDPTEQTTFRLKHKNILGL